MNLGDTYACLRCGEVFRSVTAKPFCSSCDAALIKRAVEIHKAETPEQSSTDSGSK